MIVLDASVVIDLLLDLPPHADAIARLVAREAPALAAPHLLDAEVGQVLRRYTRGGALHADHATAALEDLADLPITRYPHGPLLTRAFSLRDDATVYDALYLSLAEAIGARFVTRDSALAAIPTVR